MPTGDISDLVARGLIVPSPDFAVEKLPDGRSQIKLLRQLKKAGPSGCFRMTINAGTVNGNFATVTGGCIVTVSAALPVEDFTYCCDDGEPVPGCIDCNCLENCTFTNSPTLTPDTCTGCSGTWSICVDLVFDGTDWILTIFNSLGVNCLCGGAACAFNNGADGDPSYNLGPDPLGNHVIDYVGAGSGANYHYEIDISIA